MINEHQLRITGGVSIPSELILDTQYALKLKADCIKVEEKSNHDGTTDRIYKLELTGEVDIENETTKIIGKDTKAFSKRWRDACWNYSQSHQITMSPEAFYNQVMGKALWNADEVIEYILKQE